MTSICRRRILCLKLIPELNLFAKVIKHSFALVIIKLLMAHCSGNKNMLLGSYSRHVMMSHKFIFNLQ